MKLILLSIVLTLAITNTSCKSRDKCGDCPKFSTIEDGGKKKQI